MQKVREFGQVDCYHGVVYIASKPEPRAGLRTVFLDRDGVLNVKMPEGHYVMRWDEFHALPGAAAAIRMLNDLGVRVIVVSNQRGIALGLYTAEDVKAIHSAFQGFLLSQGAHVDAFYFCPHNRGECLCRKPLTGMFDEAMAEFPTIDAQTSLMVGDSRSDMEFGRRLGMKTAFIDSQSDDRESDAKEARQLADFCFTSLYECICELRTALAAF
jgi:D-glycero-D-manno-heptose 1,7-bisphosphate phosphatase